MPASSSRGWEAPECPFENPRGAPSLALPRQDVRDDPFLGTGSGPSRRPGDSASRDNPSGPNSYIAGPQMRLKPEYFKFDSKSVDTYIRKIKHYV